MDLWKLEECYLLFISVHIDSGGLKPNTIYHIGMANDEVVAQ